MKKLKTVLLSTALIGLSSKALMGMGMNWDSQDWGTELASQLAGAPISSSSPYVTALQNLEDYKSDFQNILADHDLSSLVQGGVLDQIKILHQLASIPESNRAAVRTMALNLAGENSVNPQDLIYTMMHLNALSSLQLTQLQTTPLNITYFLETSLHDLTQQAVSVLPEYPLDATIDDLDFLKGVFSNNTSLSLALLQHNIGTNAWRQMITQNTSTVSISGLLSYFYSQVLHAWEDQEATQISVMQAFTSAAQTQVFHPTGEHSLSNSDIVKYANLWQLFSGYKNQLFQGLTGADLRAALGFFDNDYARSNMPDLMSNLISASFLGDDSSFNAALVSGLVNEHVLFSEDFLRFAKDAKIFQNPGDSLSINDALHYLNLLNTFFDYRTQFFEGLTGAELRATLDLFDNNYAKSNIVSLMGILTDLSLLGSDTSFNATLVSMLLNDRITHDQISPIISWVNVDSESAANTVQKVLLAVGVNTNNLNSHITGSLTTLMDQLFDGKADPAHLQEIATILTQTESITLDDMTNKILMADFLITNQITYHNASDTRALLLELLRLGVTPKDLEDHAKVVLAQSLLGAEPNIDAGHINDMLTGITLHSASHIVDTGVSALGYVFYANSQSAVDDFIAASNPTLSFHEGVEIVRKNHEWGEDQVLDQHAYPILSYIEEVHGETLDHKKARYAILRAMNDRNILTSLGTTESKKLANLFMPAGWGIYDSSDNSDSYPDVVDHVNTRSADYLLVPTSTNAEGFFKEFKLALMFVNFGDFGMFGHGPSTLEEKQGLVSNLGKSIILEEIDLLALISSSYTAGYLPQLEFAAKLKEMLLAPLWPHYTDAKARTDGYWSTDAVDDFKNNPILRIAYDAAVSDGAIRPISETPAQAFFEHWSTLKTFLQDYVANGYANSYVISLLAETGRKDEIWDGFEGQTMDVKKLLVPAFARGLLAEQIGRMTSWADIWDIIHPRG